jgi:hypothetical protein
MKRTLLQLRTPLIISAFFGIVQLANAQSTWGGGGADQNWSTSSNWSAGGAPASDTVSFPDGAFPITTNVAGAVNSIVQGNTLITSLTYLNNSGSGNYNTTLIPSGSTLTVSGGLTVSDSATITSAAIKGGGSLIAGTGGTGTLLLETTGNGALLLDLSGLTNFVFNYGASSPGNLDIATLQGPSGGTQMMNLAAVSNNITVGTLNLGENNTRGAVTFNLGNGTNIINSDTINLGVSKTSGTMQFINNAGGGLKIANHTGTGRATINLGTEANSGSTGTVATGNMWFNGGTVNILAGTLTMANRSNRADSPGALANLSFNSGTVDATTINMAVNTSGGGYPTATLSVGSSGTLKIGTGGMSMVNQGGTAGAGTLIVTNGGTMICSYSIYKSTANGVATIMMNGGNLNMASLAGTIGVSNSLPIDNLNVTNSTLTLPVAASANVAVTSFNPDILTTSTINVNFMPSITAYPTAFPLITYVTGGGNLTTGGMLANLALGTLPNTYGTYQGYLSNDVATLTLWLVVTNGPSVSTVEWGGGVNNQWNTTSLNWTNNGAAVKYSDGDFVTFDDYARQSTVTITGTEKPATLEVNNNVLNYVFTGSGSIGGPVGLQKDGSASLTLAESGGDAFSQGILVNAGTLVLDDTNSSISGGLVIGGGAVVQIGNNDGNGVLPGGDLDDEGTLVFDRTNNVTVATVIPGGGALSQNGSGTLTLSTTNTYSGNTTVNNGTLALTGSGSIADSSAVMVSNATLDASGVTTAAVLTSVTLTNATLNVKAGYLQTNLTLNSLTLMGISNTVNVRSLPGIAYYPATITLLYSAGGISGYNLVLGSLPSASPAYAGTLAQSQDGNSVLLTLTTGPIGVRPSVTWSGADALSNGNTNWSDALNWNTPGVPAATESVSFNDAATAGGSPFDQSGGVGSSGSVDPANIDNLVDVNFTNASLSYANDSSGYHNTQIAPGKMLTVNGNLTVSGAGGVATILGTGAAFKVGNGGNISVENAGTAPTLDMSGLDTFTATVNQMGVGFNPASAGSNVKGTWYLARTNRISTGTGSFGTSSTLVVGGGSGSTAGTGQLYLGQTNALYVDGIVLGMSTSTGDLIEFNPAFPTNPVAYVRGITGDASRVTQWSLGDDSVNINNAVNASGLINDFTAGTLNALVGTLVVGQGSQGNGNGGHTANTLVTATFNMGAGTLNVTTLKIGVGGIGVEGAGIGIMNVSNGTVVVNALGLATGGSTNTTGTLNLTSGATLVVSNGISIGTGTAGGTLDDEFSTVEILGGTVGSASAPLSTLILDGGTLQLGVDGNNAVGNANVADIVTTNVTTGATTTINLGTVANVSGTVQIPLLSYTGTDPYSGLSLGTTPAGYTAALVDDTANSSVDLSITSLVKPTPRITDISVSGTTLTLSATNGADHGQFVLLGTTNLTKPVSQWTPILTNNFDGGGNLNLSTNILSPAVPQEFYLLSQ